MTVQGKGAVVRAQPSLDSALVATLPRDTKVVLAPSPPTVVNGKERLRVVSPVSGWVSRIALCYHPPPRPSNKAAADVPLIPKPAWLQRVAS